MSRVCSERKLSAIASPWHLKTKAIERSCCESGMQPERDVRSQFRFVVLKLKKNAQGIQLDLIRKIETESERVLNNGKGLRRNPVFQRTTAALIGESRKAPRLGAKESMIPALDFVTPIKAATIFESMEIIAHDRRVVHPTLRRR